MCKLIMNDENIKLLVKSTYDKISASYQDTYSEIDDMDRERWKTFISYCTGKKVLDLGCGTGDGTEFLSIHNCIATGIDFSEGMLNIARKKNIKGIEWVNSDICSLPFNDHSFNGIVLSYTINHLSQDMLYEIKSEIDRVLTYDGVILFVFHIGESEEIMSDPADADLQIYYHFFTKQFLESFFNNYVTIDYYQRASLDPSELMNDKGILTMMRRDKDFH